MDNTLEVSSYGISLFSVEILKEFLNKEKIKTKKVLKNFQDNHGQYIRSLKEGVWIPFLPIDSIEYIIKVKDKDEPFNNDWENKFRYQSFNIHINDSLWITSIGVLLNLEISKFIGDNISYQTLDNELLYSAFKYNIPSGKYSITIEGFARKNKLEYPNANYGFYFSLDKVDNFNEFNDPRNDDKYIFNVPKM